MAFLVLTAVAYLAGAASGAFLLASSVTAKTARTHESAYQAAR